MSEYQIKQLCQSNKRSWFPTRTEKTLLHFEMTLVESMKIQKLFYCWKLFEKLGVSFWVLKSEEEDFPLNLNLMGSFWRFVFEMKGNPPVFGMFKEESFLSCNQSIPDFEKLKGFEWLCFGLHISFNDVKRECRIWKTRFSSF